MSVVSSQQQTVLRLLGTLRPHWRRDANLSARLQQLLARHKEFGSRDRRLYREIVFTAIRYLPWVEPLLDSDTPRAIKIIAWLAAETKDTSAFRREISADWPTAGTLRQRAEFLGEDPQRLLPEWFRSECPAVFESPELEAQLARAPLWLRVQNNDPASVGRELEDAGWAVRPTPVLASALQLTGDGDVTKTATFERGAIEVQDLGSQCVLASLGLAPGGRWLDACAGAGGKTLQLARLIGADGQVDAQDIRAAALKELEVRVHRAGLENVRIVPRPTREGYDGVLVDAPCSGSGTWRRSPHLKWTTTPATMAERATLQQTLLRQFASAVKPGGRLVYATCSLAARENEAVIRRFIADHPDFAPEPVAHPFGFIPSAEGLTTLPAKHDTDGFFVSVLRRRK